jgi:hypothetical protein
LFLGDKLGSNSGIRSLHIPAMEAKNAITETEQSVKKLYYNLICIFIVPGTGF